MSISNIVQRNKTAPFPAEGLTAAIIEGRDLPGNISAESVRTYPNITEALKAVDRKLRIDPTYYERQIT